MIVLQ